jgi:hypothetical protein
LTVTLKSQVSTLSKKLETLQTTLSDSESKRAHVEILFSESVKNCELMTQKLEIDSSQKKKETERNNLMAQEIDGLGKALRAYEVLLGEIVSKLKGSNLDLNMFLGDEQV